MTGCPLARPAGRVQALELRVQAIPKVGEGRLFLSYVQGISRRCRLRIHDHRAVLSSKSTDTVRALNGDSKPSPRTLSRRDNDKDHGSDGRASCNLIDFRGLPGQAHDLQGTAALIEGLTCDQFRRRPCLRRELAVRSADQCRDRAGNPSKIKRPLRCGVSTGHTLQMVSPGRKLLRKAAGIQRDRNAFLQNS